MASRQTYIRHAEAAAQVLSEKWFGEDGLNKWVNDPDYPDYWRAPNLVIALTDLMQLTGSRSYWSTVADARKYFHEYFDPPNGRLPAFYDDECWWGSCFLRLGALTGDNAWISAAEPIFADLKGGWDDVACGGVWWRRDPKQYPKNDGDAKNEKGAIENQLYMDIAMGLHAANQKPIYLDATKQTWQWMQRLIDPTGLVWGSLEADGTIMRSNVPRPYIQGVVLAPLWALYELAGDTTYLDRAEQIAQAAIDKMTWPDGILREACEERGTCGPNDIDSTLFKGIFVRYLGEFAHRLAAIDDPARKKTAQRYAAFLQHNADAVWANFPGGIFGMDWDTPQPNYQPDNSVAWSDQYNGTLQCSALDLFVAAALVSQ